eukprot:Phypoly_transcript_14045.p1 GENE.Phypoly_transcript_14045~~Phypoly_transcript_14045.p1  ORF type:complete len:262 (+),score=39.89 Phypoly_transcript_14045:117-902(+)
MGMHDEIDDVLFSSAHVADKTLPQPPSAHVKPRRAVRFDESTKHQPSPSIFADRGRSRMSKPGSKKYRRFMNNVELLETALSDSEGEEFEIEVEYTVEFRSPFTVIFEDDEFRAKWDPFIEITEEEEARLLAMLEASREALRKEKKLKSRDTTVPSECWKNLGKYARKTVFDHHDSPVFESLDKRMIDFIMSRTNKRTLPLSSPFQRLLCHCIAPYYSVTAHTVREGSTFYTTITKTKTTKLPTSPLSVFIKSKLEAGPFR